MTRSTFRRSCATSTRVLKCHAFRRRRFRALLPAACTSLAALLIGTVLVPGAGAAVSLKTVASGLNQPVQVSAPPGDERRLMVIEQGGTVRVIRDGKLLADPFLKISSNFTSGGERGLLSLAFPPDYESTRFVYAYYTGADGDIRVDQFRRAAGSRDTVEPGYRRNVINVSHHEAGNHNGGTVTFGPGGHMYIGTGDGGQSYDTGNSPPDAQNTASLLGKLLRIDPLPGGGYTSTPGNPFGTEVFAYGLRNPFRFSFDRANGALTIGDVGQDTEEEIDYAPGGGLGLNFGWDNCEGNVDVSSNSPGGPCTAPQTAPVITYNHATSTFCSITGGVVVRDASVADLAGRYVFGDLCQDRLRSAVLGPGGATGLRVESALRVSQPVGFAEDGRGRVYVSELSGRVSRIEEPSRPGAQTVVARGSLRVRARLRQRVLRKRRIALRVRCDQPCSLRVLGRLSAVERAKRRTLSLRQLIRRRFSGSEALALKIGPRGRRAIRRTLRAHRKVTAKVVVRSRAASGALSSVTLRVRIIG